MSDAYTRSEFHALSVGEFDASVEDARTAAENYLRMVFKERGERWDEQEPWKREEMIMTLARHAFWTRHDEPR